MRHNGTIGIKPICNASASEKQKSTPRKQWMGNIKEAAIRRAIKWKETTQQTRGRKQCR